MARSNDNDSGNRRQIQQRKFTVQRPRVFRIIHTQHLIAVARHAQRRNKESNRSHFIGHKADNVVRQDPLWMFLSRGISLQCLPRGLGSSFSSFPLQTVSTRKPLCRLRYSFPGTEHHVEGLVEKGQGETVRKDLPLASRNWRGGTCVPLYLGTCLLSLRTSCNLQLRSRRRLVSTRKFQYPQG